MKKLLGGISIIQTGLFAKPIGKGEVTYLQMKHIDEFGELKNPLKSELRLEDISDRHLLRSGDVLFAAKGLKNIAVVFSDTSHAAVASTSFFVIRLETDLVLPEYLAWFINFPSNQAILKAQAMGSSMPSISKFALENLEISIPEKSIQESILKISQLRKQEKKIRAKLVLLNEIKLDKMLIDSIK